jgi:DnaJ homologue, subfamily C, member 28, conserved domain
MDALARLAEQKILAAIRRGEFDDLPGKGKPIAHEDLTGVPEELRMGYKVLKNAGMLPEELELNRQFVTLGDLLACCNDPAEREALHRRRNYVQLQFSILMERHCRQPAWRQYGERLRRRFGL